MKSEETDETDAPPSPATLAAFERLLEIELEGHTVWEEGRRHDEEVATSKKVYAALKVKPWEIRPLRLESDAPPLWIARVPELASRWQRAHRQYCGEEVEEAAEPPRVNGRRGLLRKVKP